MSHRKLLSIAAVLAVTVSAPAHSWGLKDLGGIVSATTGVPIPGTGVTAGLSAEAQQEQIIVRYAQASTAINTALMHLSNAYDMKDQAAALEAEITAMQSGAVMDRDALKKNSATSSAALEAIQARIAAGEALSDERKDSYKQALLPFAQGLLIATVLPADLAQYSAAAKQQLMSASMFDKMSMTTKLSTGTFLVTEIPGFVTRTLTGFKQIVSFAQSNQIEVPADATSLLN